MNYMYVIVATILLAFEFAFSKKYQSMEGVDLAAGLRFNVFSGLISALIMWALLGFKLEWSGYSVVLALGLSLCALSYSLLSFQVLKLGGMALYSTFLMSGGMLLPYVFGVFFLDETVSLFRIVGVLVILCAVILSNFSKEKVSIRLILLCVAVFILNGCVSIISKCHQISAQATVSSTAFVMYAGICKSLLSAALLVFFPKPVKLQRKLSLGVVAGAAIIGAVSYLLQLIGARALPASVLYPIVTGGSIIFSAIAGRVSFKEHLSRRQILGIILCFVGTLLFL